MICIHLACLFLHPATVIVTVQDEDRYQTKTHYFHIPAIMSVVYQIAALPEHIYRHDFAIRDILVRAGWSASRKSIRFTQDVFPGRGWVGGKDGKAKERAKTSLCLLSVLEC